MREQRRGEGTKTKILEVACKVFAEKGYRDATHAEICRRAGANTASVNYYFASKNGLYRAVFHYLRQKVERLHPLDGGLPESAAPEKRLQAFIHAHLSRVFDPETMGDLHRIRMAEMFDPTGALEDLLADQLAHDREHVQRILRELLRPHESQRDVEWCEMSIVSQCFIGAPEPPTKGPRDHFGLNASEPPVKGPRDLFGLNASEVDRLTEHIWSFSIAGIKAIRRKRTETAESKHTRSGNAK